MNIEVKDPPHNIRQLCEELFDIKEDVVFTYGGTIYNPSGRSIGNDVLVHEAVHADQQGQEPAKWWDRYFQDDQFRFEQELQAYQVQYAFVAKSIKDRNQLFRYLNILAGDLSGPVYGHLCTLLEARKKIKGVV